MDEHILEFEDLPESIQELINTHYEKSWLDTYKHTLELLEILKPLNYTFEFGLDGEPYDFQKIDPNQL